MDNDSEFLSLLTDLANDDVVVTGNYGNFMPTEIKQEPLEYNYNDGLVDWGNTALFGNESYLKHEKLPLNSDSEDDEDEYSGNDKKRRRSANNNNESEAITEATSQYLKALNIDPDSREGKKQRRRIRNRMSAQMHREKKRAYIETLENGSKEKDLLILSLSEKVKILSEENEVLKRQLLSTSRTSHPGTDDSEYFSDESAEKEPNTLMGSEGSMSPIWVLGNENMDVLGKQPVTPSRAPVTLFSFLFMLGLTFHFSNYFIPTSSISNVLHQNYVPLQVSSNWEMVGGGRVLMALAEMEGVSDESDVPIFSAPPPNIVTLRDSNEFTSTNAPDSISQKVVLVVPNVELSDKDKPSDIFASDMNRFAIHSHSHSTSVLSNARTAPLWKYQKHIADLYPPSTVLHPQQAPHQEFSSTTFGAENRTSSSAQPNRRYLRVRTNSTTSAAGSDNVKQNGRSHANSNVGLFSPSESSMRLVGSQVQRDREIPQMPQVGFEGLSQVLVTQGRILLNPMLASFPSVVHAHASPVMGERSNSDVALSSDSLKQLQTNTAVNERAIVSSWSGVGRAGGGAGASDADTTRGVNGEGTSSGMDVQNLVMLIPANSIQWGDRWEHPSAGASGAFDGRSE